MKTSRLRPAVRPRRLGALAIVAFASGCSITPTPEPRSAEMPCLRLETRLGAIVLALDPAAAPLAVSALTRAGGERGDAWAGLGFDYARPRLELRLPAPPSAASSVPAEIDAGALDLDATRLGDEGDAMDWIQNELYLSFRRPSAERQPTAQGRAWAARFEENHDPSFLVGTARRELLEALGYRFESGLASKPPTAGAVLLVPSAPDRATLELSLLLAEHRDRTGRWVVVGSIVEGAEVATAISLMPLANPGARDYRPSEPVRVEHSKLERNCSATNGAEGTP